MRVILSQAKGGDTVGIVEVQLLVAKVYSQWENHFSSALAVYDGLIEKNPNDFRYNASLDCPHKGF